MVFRLPCASHYRYVPRSSSLDSPAKEVSGRLLGALKNGRAEGVVRGLVKECDRTKHSHDPFLGTDVLLVPMPRSSLRTPGALWPALELCHELMRAGLGADVGELLTRISAVPKSATAAPGERTSPAEHFRSMRAEQQLLAHEAVTIVDDIVTRGATFVGGAAHLRRLYPAATIRGFALAQTERGVFDTVHAPWVGEITYDRATNNLERR